MKNKKLLIALISAAAVVIVTVATILIVVGVKNRKPVPTEEPIKPAPITESLDKPVNLAVNDNVLTWDAVLHATSYVVYVGDKEYVVETNSYTLGEVTGKVKLAIKAKGEGYIDSVKSAEIVYVATVDDADVQKSNASLTAFMEQNGLTVTEDEINTLGTQLYKVGLISDNVDALCVSLQNVIDSLGEIKQIADKGEASIVILRILLEMVDQEADEYSLIEGARLFGAFFLGKKADALEVALAPEPEPEPIPEPEPSPLRHRRSIENYETEYYSDEELVASLRAASVYLANLNAKSVQNITYTLAFFRTYEAQLKSLLAKFQSAESFVDDALYNDLAALKNAIVGALVNTMPSKYDFDELLATLEGLFEAILPTSLQGLITFDGVRGVLINFYSANHYLISFLNSLTDADVKELLSDAQAVVKSLSEGIIAEITTTIASITDPEFSPEKVLQDVETIAMAAAGKWFEQYPIYGQIISLGYPESLSEVFPYLAEVLKALGAEEYVELSEENVTKIQNYFMGLIPEMVMNPLDSEEDFADFLYQCHFENGLVFDKEAFNEKLDEIDLVALVKGEITMEEVLATFDWASYFTYDVSALKDSIQLAMDTYMPELSHFLMLLQEDDPAMVIAEFGIEDLEYEQIEALVAHIQEALGFVDGANPFESLVGIVVEDLQAYVQENYPVLFRIPEIATFIQEMKELSENPAAAAAGTLVNNDQPLSINLIAIYKAYALATNRYAKFLNSYQAPYAEGLTINYESLVETAFDGIGYFFLGNHMQYAKGILNNVLTMASKAGAVFGAASDLLEACAGYAQNVCGVITEEAILDGTVIDQVLAELLVAANDVQGYYSALRSLLGLTDFKAINNLIYDWEIAEGYNAEAVEHDREGFEQSMQEAVWFVEDLDAFVASLPSRVEGLQEFYAAQKELLTPVVEFLLTSVRAYLGAEYSEKMTDFEDYLLDEDTKAAIEALYNPEVFLAMGAALNKIYAPFDQEAEAVDYVVGMQGTCGKIEGEFESWNDPESTLYADRVALVMSYLRFVIAIDQVIGQAKEYALQLEELINDADAERSTFNLVLTDLQQLVYDYFISDDYLDLIELIDLRFGIEMYKVDTTEEPFATLFNYTMDEDTWKEVRTALGIKEVVKITIKLGNIEIDVEELKAMYLYDILVLVDSFTKLLNNDFAAGMAKEALGFSDEMINALKMIDMTVVFSMIDSVPGLKDVLQAYTLNQVLNGEMLASMYEEFIACIFTISEEHQEFSETEQFYAGLITVIPSMIIAPDDEDRAIKIAALPEIWRQFFIDDPTSLAGMVAVQNLLQSLQAKELGEIILEYVVAPVKEVTNQFVINTVFGFISSKVGKDVWAMVEAFLTEDEMNYLLDWDFAALEQCFYDRLEALVLSEVFEEYVYEDIALWYHSAPYDKLFMGIVHGIFEEVKNQLGIEPMPEPEPEPEPIPEP